MVNPSKRYGKKRYRKFRRSRFSKKNPWNIAKYVVNKALNKRIEKKYEDLVINHSLLTTSSIFDVSAAIQLGTGADQRIGAHINLSSIFLRYFVNPANATPTINRVRISVVQGKQVLSVLDCPTMFGAINSEKMRILYDKVHTFVELGASDYGGVPTYVQGEAELFINKMIQYTANTGGLGDTTNGIYLMTRIENASSTHTIDGFMRIKFRDA